jgi:hypothetical protein
MEALLPLLAKLQDPAVLVLVLVCIGEGYLHVVWRREEREDRKSLLEVLNQNTKALSSVQIAIAAMTGKAS